MNINTFAKQFQILINIFFGRVMKSRKEINFFWFSLEIKPLTSFELVMSIVSDVIPTIEYPIDLSFFLRSCPS